MVAGTVCAVAPWGSNAKMLHHNQEKYNMKFKKEELIDIVYGDHDNYSVVYEENDENRRWTYAVTIVFKDETTGKLYMTHFERGNTENQWVEPFEYEPDEIECTEVDWDQISP